MVKEKKDKYAHKKNPSHLGGGDSAGPSTQGNFPVTDGDLAESAAHLRISPNKAPSGMWKILTSADPKKFEGTKGRPCSMEVNYLEIDVKKMISKAYHYDVKFDPNVPKKLLPIACDAFMETFFRGVRFAFDGRANIYMDRMLEFNGTTIDSDFGMEVEPLCGDNLKKFKVTVTWTGNEIDLNVLKIYKNAEYQNSERPSQAIQCLDVILRTAFKPVLANHLATAVGRALYFPGNPSIDLSEGMELWRGLFQSAILGRDALYLNVDVAHKAFPSAVPVLSVVKGLGGDERNPLKPYLLEKLHDHLKMLRIEYQINSSVPPRTRGYIALTDPAREATFADDNQKKWTVVEYFKSKNIQLKYPAWPCLRVGSSLKLIYWPLEFCRIPPGQGNNKKCPSKCLQKMIGFSATTTAIRKQNITRLLGKVSYANSADIKGFQIGVDSKFQNVEGRVINPPQIKYPGGNITPSNGSWDDRNKKFLEVQNHTIKWAIINCDPVTGRGYGGVSAQQVTALASMISRESRNKGMNFANFNQAMDCAIVGPKDLPGALEHCSKEGYHVVFVIVNDNPMCYPKIKQEAELRQGVLTQCLKSSTAANKCNPMTIKNILLKVNAKLNGKNHEVEEVSYKQFNAANSGVMFVGADVTHPSPDQKDVPSVVGVAASHDQVGFKYCFEWRLQKGEMILDLKAIIFNRLKFYREKNGKLPAKIMYYRDGVSEGEFQTVLDVEMTAIRDGMKAIYGNVKPALVTFIVVQKRHHTRFFPAEGRGEGKQNNVWPGTVVDRKIVHPFRHEFFLASHQAIKGVTKPAKYCVLYDESQINVDDLQAITFDLCHLFSRCNRSVSYPAPTYYAHHAAARGKVYIQGAKLNINNLAGEFKNLTIRPDFAQKNPMFFV